jgi:hypothetical protein
MYANNSTGGWRCRVKVRARQRAADLAYWHAPGGGYVKRRKRDLANERERILGQLDQLAQEASSAES